jgi:hypothetical protein
LAGRGNGSRIDERLESGELDLREAQGETSEKGVTRKWLLATCRNTRKSLPKTGEL